MERGYMSTVIAFAMACVQVFGFYESWIQASVRSSLVNESKLSLVNMVGGGFKRYWYGSGRRSGQSRSTEVPRRPGLLVSATVALVGDVHRNIVGNRTDDDTPCDVQRGEEIFSRGVEKSHVRQVTGEVEAWRCLPFTVEECAVYMRDPGRRGVWGSSRTRGYILHKAELNRVCAEQCGMSIRNGWSRVRGEGGSVKVSVQIQSGWETSVHKQAMRSDEKLGYVNRTGKGRISGDLVKRRGCSRGIESQYISSKRGWAAKEGGSQYYVSEERAGQKAVREENDVMLRPGSYEF
ncbi:hypothetical protein K435DRAFT_795911 [Dendrothele bispora CBS 962.96]|uniref:Uncharacterized protein n=1 Tax=Dendrothele bispora (strain CBS 962.96) TaxID=1314807 RepID=A0A4S8M782_DENBC|nr:hypothetical protein K435DRAFT_795911 [Dendrothele bispora CBS 962.96]